MTHLRLLFECVLKGISLHEDPLHHLEPQEDSTVAERGGRVERLGDREEARTNEGRPSQSRWPTKI